GGVDAARIADGPPGAADRVGRPWKRARSGTWTRMDLSGPPPLSTSFTARPRPPALDWRGCRTGTSHEGLGHAGHRRRGRRRGAAAAAGADQCPPGRADAGRGLRVVRLVPGRHRRAGTVADGRAHAAAAGAAAVRAAAVDLAGWDDRCRAGAGVDPAGAEDRCRRAGLPGGAGTGAGRAGARPFRRARCAASGRSAADRRRPAGPGRRDPGDAAMAGSMNPMELPAGQMHALESAYATPPRAYHDFSHVAEVLRHYDAVASGPGWVQPLEVRLAVLYHDAVYEPGRKDNETRSAVFAVEEIGRWLPDAGVDRARVAELIELTARHGQFRPGDFG